MRTAIHPNEWRTLQAACERLSAAPGVVWVGVTASDGPSGWLAFAGGDEHAPFRPDPDQHFREIPNGEPDIGVVELVPPRAGRTFACGMLLSAGLMLIAVPDPARPMAFGLVVEGV